jgi:hypothetical protein
LPAYSLLDQGILYGITIVPPFPTENISDDDHAANLELEANQENFTEEEVIDDEVNNTSDWEDDNWILPITIN